MGLQKKRASRLLKSCQSQPARGEWSQRTGLTALGHFSSSSFLAAHSPQAVSQRNSVVGAVSQQHALLTPEPLLATVTLKIKFA